MKLAGTAVMQISPAKAYAAVIMKLKCLSKAWKLFCCQYWLQLLCTSVDIANNLFKQARYTKTFPNELERQRCVRTIA